MSDRNQNESVSHALLALGIVLLLISSIIIAWIIVCCERCRRKRKYRPGQQTAAGAGNRSGSGASITRSGPSPLINRHLLVPKASQHLVIANKAFLSKSTPHLVFMEELLGEEEGDFRQANHPEDSWRLQGISTPTPSEPLFSSPYKVKGVMSSVNPTTANHAIVTSRPRPRPETNSQPQSVPRSRSEPLIPQFQQPGTSDALEKDDQGSVQELSIHDQILAILGTFPSLGFDFFIPTKSSTPLKHVEVDFEAVPQTDEAVNPPTPVPRLQNGSKDVSLDMEHNNVGPESSVDGDIILDDDNEEKLTKNTPLLSNKPVIPTITLNGNGYISSPLKKIKPKPNPRPTTLKFVEERRYDFVDVEVTCHVETREGGNDKVEDQEDLPPLLETTL